MKKVEFGDFQTPLSLAQKCCELVYKIIKPTKIIEPTCGMGSFIEASYEVWGNSVKYEGYEINNEYVDSIKKNNKNLFKIAKIKNTDFFSLDISSLLKDEKKVLLIGNPPWVTNSKLGQLSSTNLPKKSNIKGLSGMDAMSGKSNFDISEWMILKLCEELAKSKGVLAMLCKTSVARNVFQHLNKTQKQSTAFKIFKIDSKKEFDVSVDACLFVVDYLNGGEQNICETFAELDLKSKSSKIGIIEKRVIADLVAYSSTVNKVLGETLIPWRSGIKHDASSVMELYEADGRLLNGLDEIVDIEDEYVFPLLKSSDLANDRLKANRYVIVTQKKVGDDTSHLKASAPKLWKYLNKHKDKLDGRKSSIYKTQSSFAMFGLGDYSFKPFKIAISGLYKNVKFCLLKSVDGKSIMVDDTCYQLGFSSLGEAKKHLSILESDLIFDYLRSLIFFDAKRPINTDILNSIDFAKAELHCQFKKPNKPSGKPSKSESSATI